MDSISPLKHVTDKYELRTNIDTSNNQIISCNLYNLTKIEIEASDIPIYKTAPQTPNILYAKPILQTDSAYTISLYSTGNNGVDTQIFCTNWQEKIQNLVAQGIYTPEVSTYNADYPIIAHNIPASQLQNLLITYSTDYAV